MSATASILTLQMQEFLAFITPTFSDCTQNISNISRTMQTFKVILEHKVTQKLMFITVEECNDIDDCIDHIHSTAPDFQIESITEVK